MRSRRAGSSASVATCSSATWVRICSTSGSGRVDGVVAHQPVAVLEERHGLPRSGVRRKPTKSESRLRPRSGRTAPAARYASLGELRLRPARRARSRIPSTASFCPVARDLAELQELAEQPADRARARSNACACRRPRAPCRGLNGTAAPASAPRRSPRPRSCPNCRASPSSRTAPRAGRGTAARARARASARSPASSSRSGAARGCRPCRRATPPLLRARIADGAEVEASFRRWCPGWPRAGARRGSPSGTRGSARAGRCRRSPPPAGTRPAAAPGTPVPGANSLPAATVSVLLR